MNTDRPGWYNSPDSRAYFAAILHRFEDIPKGWRMVARMTECFTAAAVFPFPWILFLAVNAGAARVAVPHGDWQLMAGLFVVSLLASSAATWWNWRQFKRTHAARLEQENA